MISNKERLRRYRKRMDAAGFKRLSFYASPMLIIFIENERKQAECGGRTLERLLIGHSMERPDFYADDD